MSTSCLFSTIAPQAIEANERNTYGSFTGSAVQNITVAPAMHRLNSYSHNNALSVNNAVCRSGIMGIDNQCICPGSMNQMPFQQSPLQPIVNTLLFQPFVEGMMTEVSPVAKQLIAERRPLPQDLAGGYNLDRAIPCPHTQQQKQGEQQEMRQQEMKQQNQRKLPGQ